MKDLGHCYHSSVHTCTTFFDVVVSVVYCHGIIVESIAIADSLLLRVWTTNPPVSPQHHVCAIHQLIAVASACQLINVNECACTQQMVLHLSMHSCPQGNKCWPQREAAVV